MKLYTRHGDTGQTTLVGGKRVMKDDIRIAVCGDLDELNAHIGMLLSFGVPAVSYTHLTLPTIYSV